MSSGLYVQYGCGWSAPKGWRNFDASPTLRFERLPILGRLYTRNACRFPRSVEFGDIVKGLPVEDGSCCAVYCSHVLEHLSLDDLRTALRNSHRMLQLEGIFRLVLPDLERFITDYTLNQSPDAGCIFMRQTRLGRERRPRSLGRFLVEWLGASQHLWMWDYRGMKSELKDAGFYKIRRATFGDSSDPRFADVEDSARWEDCLGIECRKSARNPKAYR